MLVPRKRRISRRMHRGPNPFRSRFESVDMVTYFDLMPLLKDAGAVLWEEEHGVLKVMGPFIPLDSAPNGQRDGYSVWCLILFWL